MKFREWPSALVAVLMSATMFVAGAAYSRAVAQQPVGESKLFEVLKRGTVIAGVTGELPPFGFIDANGNLVGLDIDIARLIADSLFGDRMKIQFKRIAWAARWPAVNGGQVDFGIMDTTIWKDRLPRVNFTRPYMKSGFGVMVQADLPIDSVEKLNDPRYTMAILDTPSEWDVMKKELPKMKVIPLASLPDLLTAVRTGRAHALMDDLAVVAWRTKNLPGVKYIGKVGSPFQNAIFLRQNDFQWWYYLDAMVGEMRCGSLYPEFSAIYQRWFGVKPPDPDTCNAFSNEDAVRAFTGKGR